MQGNCPACLSPTTTPRAKYNSLHTQEEEPRDVRPTDTTPQGTLTSDPWHQRQHGPHDQSWCSSFNDSRLLAVLSSLWPPGLSGGNSCFLALSSNSDSIKYTWFYSSSALLNRSWNLATQSESGHPHSACDLGSITSLSLTFL